MVNLKFVIRLLTLLALVACSPNVPVSQPTGTKDSYLLSTAVSTKTLVPTEKPTARPTLTPSIVPTSTPLVIIPPYQTKQVVLEYAWIGSAGGSPDHIFDGLFRYATEFTKFVLYTDGQFIFQDPPNPIRTKIFTEAEKKQLLSLLDKKDFYSVETNGASDPTDLIYDFRGKYDEVKITDGDTSCISVNTTISKKVCYYEPYQDFLLPRLKELFRFFYYYAPSNLEVYKPDRLLVFVSKGRDFYDSYVGKPTESIPWPLDLPSLETPKEKYMMLEGKTASKGFSLFETDYWPKVFSENGQDYSVYINVIFPHEKSMRP